MKLKQQKLAAKNVVSNVTPIIVEPVDQAPVDVAPVDPAQLNQEPPTQAPPNQEFIIEEPVNDEEPMLQAHVNSVVADQA